VEVLSYGGRGTGQGWVERVVRAKKFKADMLRCHGLWHTTDPEPSTARHVCFIAAEPGLVRGVGNVQIEKRRHKEMTERKREMGRRGSPDAR